MSEQLIHCLEAVGEVPRKDRDILISFFEKQHYNEGEILYAGNSVCTELFFITKGVLKIVSVNEKGADVTHYFYNENHFCTILPSFFDGSKGEAGIAAACEAEVLAISNQHIRQLYHRLPYINKLFDAVFRQQLIEKVYTRNAYIGEDAETQYRLFVEKQPDIALRVPVKDIASFLGITPQSLSRIRKNIR